MKNRTRPPMRWQILAALLAAALSTTAQQAIAQTPDSLLPVKPAYNLGDYEFLIGADDVIGSDPQSTWQYFDSLGVKVPYVAGASLAQIDALSDPDGTYWAPWRRFLPKQQSPLSEAGFGREVQFYPFDSV